MRQAFLLFSALSVGALGVILPPLPARADCAMDMALERLNQYRLRSGLAPLNKWPDFESAAQSHADYYAQNCFSPAKGKLDPYNRVELNHFERPLSVGYTSAGRGAARTSGLALNALSPLQAVEMLLALPYHRTQLLDASSHWVGAGFSAAKAECRIGLFMTRYPDTTSPPPTLPHRGTQPTGYNSAVVFPPHGMTNVPAVFNPGGESPDPRPADHAKVTGYPISIRFYNEDWVRNVVGVVATLTDEKGKTIDLDVSFPRKPAISMQNAPGGLFARPDRANGPWWIGRNHDSVFLLPKAQLRHDAKYTVRVKLILENSTKPVEEFSWFFSTVPSGGDVLTNPAAARAANWNCTLDAGSTRAATASRGQ